MTKQPIKQAKLMTKIAVAVLPCTMAVSAFAADAVEEVVIVAPAVEQTAQASQQQAEQVVVGATKSVDPQPVAMQAKAEQMRKAQQVAQSEAKQVADTAEEAKEGAKVVSEKAEMLAQVPEEAVQNAEGQAQQIAQQKAMAQQQAIQAQQAKMMAMHQAQAAQQQAVQGNSEEAWKRAFEHFEGDK